jgi:hypothetical protein
MILTKPIIYILITFEEVVRERDDSFQMMVCRASNLK